jgi:hypothetical protein
MKMNEFCPRDCKYLNLTEEKQNMLAEPVLHKCLKYNVRLYHMLAHPELYKCEECLKETKNETFYE